MGFSTGGRFKTINVPSIRLTSPFDINNSGQIVGVFVTSTVTEPSTCCCWDQGLQE